MKIFLSLFFFSFIYFFSTNAQEIDSLLNELQKTSIDSNRYIINIEIGYSLMQNNPDSARDYFLNALNLANKLDDELKMASSLTLTGVTYYFNGQFDQAMEYYHKALPLAESSGNIRYCGIISNNIGAVYYEMENFENTQVYYEKSINYFKMAKDTFWLSNSLNNLANLYEKEEKHARATEVYLESLQLAKKSGNKEAIGSVVSNLGNVYMAMGKFDEALLQYSQGLQIQIESGDATGEAITYNNIGQVYTQKKMFPEAIRNHKKALSLAEEIEHLETMKNANKWLSATYKTMGFWKEAYTYQSGFLVLKDSLTGIEKANVVEEINQKYQSEQKERKITELELDRKTADLALVSFQNQRNVFIFAALILLGVVGFIWNRNVQKQKTSKILENKNLQISLALEDRGILLKEIHHRVKNNLQVISSLLNLQADSLDDEAASDAVKEGQHRVKSMALIHQKLYNTKDVRGVDIQDYLETLANQLFQSFGLDSERVTYKVEAQGLTLDIDTVIPLGLIMNELITNSIKYAFQGTEKGELLLQIKETGNQLIVVVKDNGAGMSVNEMEKSNSFGWKMIRSLNRKLKAEINIYNDQGTVVELTLSRYKLVV